MTPEKRRPMGIFLQQLRLNFRETGALFPSSKALARAMTAHIEPGDAPRRILEAGPGTGVFTEEIARRMGPLDHLDIYEINPVFADVLEARLLGEPVFHALEGRVVLHRGSVLEVSRDAVYDRIISGVPLNNFEASWVREFLETMMSRLSAGGILSWFEYALVRAVKSCVSGRQERERLRGVGSVTAEYLSLYGLHNDAVLMNFPPAVARHLVKPLGLPRPISASGRALRPAAAVQ